MADIIPFKPKQRRLTRQELEFKFACDMLAMRRRWIEQEIEATDSLLRAGRNSAIFFGVLLAVLFAFLLWRLLHG
jgi:hypothetical protein